MASPHDEGKKRGRIQHGSYPCNLFLQTANAYPMIFLEMTHKKSLHKNHKSLAINRTVGPV
jgi:hypothetical protein